MTNFEKLEEVFPGVNFKKPICACELIDCCFKCDECKRINFWDNEYKEESPADKEARWNAINRIEAYGEQIITILDLMMGCDKCVDMRSIRSASEMAWTMMGELMDEVKYFEGEKGEKNGRI